MVRFWLGGGILQDIKARAPYYVDDWKEGLNSGFRILAPSLYVFFASVIPALAFGEQISANTNGVFNGVHMLVGTAICGVIQAIFGGQPLLITGVAQPIIIIYIMVYNICDDYDISYQPFCTMICLWTSVMVFILAGLGTCKMIDKFTRFSGELFGMLIASLFMLQAIQGLQSEFQTLKVQNDAETRCGLADGLEQHEIDNLTADGANMFHWRLVNGLWGIMLGIGLLFSSLSVFQARTWRIGKGWVRGLLADYGVPVMVVVWTGISYAIVSCKIPPNIPRRLRIPNVWEDTDSWKSVTKLSELNTGQVFLAMIPAVIITVLFYFDHNVSAQLAQQEEFNLKKPPAYSYDFALLGVMTAMSGLLGLPPANGAIPQSPMHTKALATLKNMLRLAELKTKEKEQKGVAKKTWEQPEAAAKSAAEPESAKKLDEDFDAGDQKTSEQHQKDAQPDDQIAINKAITTGKGLSKGANSASSSSVAGTSDDDAQTKFQSSSLPCTSSEGQLNKLAAQSGKFKSVNAPTPQNATCTFPIEVKEQRLSGLLQSLMCAACIGATPALKLIPVAVLWGYFAYMSISSLPGSQFWDRLCLLVTNRKKRYLILEEAHAPYLETVPFKTIVLFTLFQLALLVGIFAMTFGGIVGIFFPIIIMALVPFREYVMPKMFKNEYLQELDANEEQLADPMAHEDTIKAAAAVGVMLDEDDEIEREQLEHQFVGRQQPHVIHHLTREEMDAKSQRRSRDGPDSSGAHLSSQASGVHVEQVIIDKP